MKIGYENVKVYFSIFTHYNVANIFLNTFYLKGAESMYEGRR